LSISARWSVGVGGDDDETELGLLALDTRFAVDGDEADATGIAGIKQRKAADVVFELEQRK
jgi:hypothetical protein